MRDAVADDYAEQVGAQDSQSAADHRSNQALQAHHAEPDFKENDEDANRHSHATCKPGREPGQAKRLQRVTDKSNDSDKNKTNEEQVHGDPPDRAAAGQGKNRRKTCSTL